MIKRRNSKLTLERRIIRLERLLKSRRSGRKFEEHNDFMRTAEKVLLTLQNKIDDILEISGNEDDDKFVIYIQDNMDQYDQEYYDDWESNWEEFVLSPNEDGTIHVEYGYSNFNDKGDEIGDFNNVREAVKANAKESGVT